TGVAEKIGHGCIDLIHRIQSSDSQNHCFIVGQIDMWNRSRIQFFALNANFGQKSWDFIPGSLNIPYLTDSRLYLKTDNGGFRTLKNGLQGDMFIIDRGHPAIVGLSVCRMNFRPDYLSG